MIPAARAVQRPPDAKLLVIDGSRRFRDLPRVVLVDLLRRGDLVVANDAATLPASLHGTHLPTGALVEVRLAARRSLESDDVSEFRAIVFGAGDYHTRTEHRPPPPALMPGDRLSLGPLDARVVSAVHPRLISLRFEGTADAIRAGIATHGRPIQYSHIDTQLMLWDVWTPIANRPVAFEPPSAGFSIDWRMVTDLRAHGVGFVTITHAAGISSTGDPLLDGDLPFEEPYEIPTIAAVAINHTKERRGRVIAIGTTVVRALEHAADEDGTVRPGTGVATQRIGAGSRLRVVDAILTGVHESGTSHYELLRAFTDDDTLESAADWLEGHHYRTHEFGDSVFLERQSDNVRSVRI
jgi:S-adenosylmethionine:tRNA ribosyltransferase-isomerase